MKKIILITICLFTLSIYSQTSGGSLVIKAYNGWGNPAQGGFDTICQNETVMLKTTFFGAAPGVADIQNNFYPSRIIGSQEWTVKNLNNSVYANGDAISGYSSANNLASNDSIYGKLYTYFNAKDSRNVCPANWHVPSDAEWNTLTNYLGGSSIAGGKLKQLGTSLWSSPNTGATNSTYFTAVPAGVKSVGLFNTPFGFGQYNFFWTSSTTYTNPSITVGGILRALGYDSEVISANPGLPSQDDHSNGYSIRCVKNTINGGIQYQWSTGQTTADISVNPSVTTTYTCTVTANGNSYTDSITIYVINPLAQISANGATNYCTGQNVTLFANPVQNATYQWKKNNVNITGATNSSYITPTNSSANGSYTVSVTLLGCTSVSNAITVSTFTNSYSIYDTICGGPYVWNGVSYSNSGNFNQTFPSQNGCDSVVTLHLIVHPNNFNPTFSSTQQLYTSPPFAVQFTNTTTNPGNYIFTWYWGDGTSTTSNNTNVFHEYLTNGLYSVTLEATSISTGCSDQTTYTDYIYTTGGVSCTHSANIVQTGPITACSGQNVVLSCNTSSNYTYQWRRNGVYISGNNNDTLIVTQPGAYSVIISDNGCPVSSSEVTVNFSTISTPVISSNGSIQPCVGGSVTLTASSGYNSYLWSNGATTQSTTVSNSGSYTVQVTNSNGCSITSSPYIINASILPTQNICVVGVDSLTNNVRVVWEKPITSAIDSFFIYRETSVSNVFAQVGARPYDSLSVWLDPNANPAVQSYRYKISALDTCGVETPLSSFHKTIHLTINQGVGNTWNLIWSNYEGISFGSYNIYRGTTPNNMSLLTTIQSNLNSYTDLTAPAGNVYYQIEIINPNNCNPTKSMSYSSSKSNIVNTNSSSLEEIIEPHFVVYPNPANELLTIESESKMNNKFFVFDAVGRVVNSGLMSSSKNTLDISGFSKGTYTLTIENFGTPIRFIKQ
jgi:uncharacterized protein (TIGR02145 family)